MILRDGKEKIAAYLISWGIVGISLILASSLLACSTKNLLGTEKLGTIFVYSNVPGAQIELDGKQTGRLAPDTLKNVPVGTHLVSVRKAGYNSDPEVDTVEVVQGELATAEFSLTNKLGALAVDSDPQGAVIILDNKNTQKVTPDTLDSVAVGTHVVSVEKPGYRSSPEFDTVEVAEDSLVLVRFTLAEKMGNIFVDSDINGAEIVLDHVSTGRMTPDTVFNVMVGDHTVSVTKEGYFPSPPSILITVNENQTSTVEFVLVQKVGSIFVNSEPSGADIILDHVPTGQTTPHTILDVAVGDHIVSVNREGYLSSPDSMLITVIEDQTSSTEFILVQKVGSIFANSDPEGADIILDHVFTGRTTPDTLFDINWGDHVVSVEKSGFLPSPESLVVAVFEDQTSSAEFILLDTRYGSLSVSSNISGATICIDNRATAEVTPQVYFNNVEVGTHIITVFKNGYSNGHPTKEIVTIITGDTVEVDFTLNSTVVGTEVGNITSDFDLEDDYGLWHRLYAYRGFVIMINFWATDCVPCMNELPYLQKIYSDYVSDSLILFGLNYWEDFDVIRRVREDEQLTFTLLKDVDGQVKSDYGVIGTPVTIILDRSGEIHLYWTGWQNPALEAKFRAALDELFGN